MVRANWRRLMTSDLADGAVRLIVVLSVIGSGYSLYQNRELTRCVARYNDANNTRSVVLTEAADEERGAERQADDAQAALFLTPGLSKPPAQRTPGEHEEILRLFRAYQTALYDQKKERAAADDARVDHPIPDPPREVCG